MIIRKKEAPAITLLKRPEPSTAQTTLVRRVNRPALISLPNAVKPSVMIPIKSLGITVQAEIKPEAINSLSDSSVYPTMGKIRDAFLRGVVNAMTSESDRKKIKRGSEASSGQGEGGGGGRPPSSQPSPDDYNKWSENALRFIVQKKDGRSQANNMTYSELITRVNQLAAKSAESNPKYQNVQLDEQGNLTLNGKFFKGSIRQLPLPLQTYFSDIRQKEDEYAEETGAGGWAPGSANEFNYRMQNPED